MRQVGGCSILSVISQTSPPAYIETPPPDAHDADVKTLNNFSHLEKLKQHVEKMRRYVHGLDGLSGGLHWQT